MTNSLKNIYEEIIKDVEFNIQQEEEPFLVDYKERTENDEFEDVSVIFVDNIIRFD